MNHLKGLLICLLLAGLNMFCFPLKAQYRDAGLWLSANAEKKITSRFSVFLSGECRMNENITQAGTFFPEAGAGFKLNKYVAFSFFYRLIERRKPDATYSTRHRLFANVVFRHKFNKVQIVIRERIQSQVSDFYSSETGRIPDWYLRSKFTVKYDISRRITPGISAELFYQLSNSAGNELDNVRYSAGIEYEFNKRHSMEPFYLIQQELHINNPATDFIIGVAYHISL